MSDPQIELMVHVGGPLPLVMRCDPDQADAWRDVLTRLGLEVSHRGQLHLRARILAEEKLYADDTDAEDEPNDHPQ